jgi:hypothetical protein
MIHGPDRFVPPRAVLRLVRRLRAPGALVVLALSMAGCGVQGAALSGPAFADGRHRGMSYAHAWRRSENRGYGTRESEESLRILSDLGVNWISVTPFGFQDRPEEPGIRWGGRRFSETDESLSQATRQAHALGIKVMLKPHVWLRPPNWVGLVAMGSEEAWAAWFANYEAFILHYATLAQTAGMDALCIGNELEKTTVRETEWRRLISRIRRVYRGPLTYGAGGYEVYEVPFWDALDFIGVSAYYPLANDPAPARTALVAAWQPIVARLAALSRRWQRPVVFTELGYRSAAAGAGRQWEWRRTTPVALGVQADAYQAFFEAVWDQPWFGGVYWWKWLSYPAHGGPQDNDYSPRNKPAEEVLRKNYR